LRGEANEHARAVLDLSLELTARMVILSGMEQSLDAARVMVEGRLHSGAALERFRANVEAQGGDARVCDDPSRLFDLTLSEVRIESPRTGFVKNVDAAEIGHAVVNLGGGRVRIEDTIDQGVGFLAEVKIGDQLKAGETIGLLYCRSESQVREAIARIEAAYEISDEPPSARPTLIKEVITA
jgi:thymidine phosphorylase